MTLKKYLKKLHKAKRKSYHPLTHKINKKFGISTRTLHYIKEYNTESGITKKIIKESLGILIFASVVSSAGGLFLEHIKTTFISLIPLIILLPTLNDMIGDYGMIISSRFTTMLFKGGIKNKITKNKELLKLFSKILIIAIITSIFSLVVSFLISGFSGFNLTFNIATKISLMILIDVLVLIFILCLIAFFLGIFFYKRNEDPDNFLIPITTSIADFGNMFILAFLVVLFF